MGCRLRHKEQWSVGSHWVAKGAVWCHSFLAFRLGLVLGTHCGDCSIHFCTSFILYQVEGFLSVWSAFWREGRVGGR